MNNQGYFDASSRNKAPEIEQANRRMNRLGFATAFGMFLYGLLLPPNWESLFGLFGWPIAWAARTAPATVKLAGLSPIPELVQGFFGLAAWASVLFALVLAWRDPLEARVRFAFSKSRGSFLKTFCFTYLFALPIMIIGLWVVFFMPIEIDMTGGHTWGMKLMVQMITDRFAMAFFGGIYTIGVGGLFWTIIGYIVGPILMIVRRDR